MTRKEQFVTLVQTAAIVESLSPYSKPDTAVKMSTTAAIAVHAAMHVEEGSLPIELTEACEALIAYVFHNTIPKPIWMAGIL